MKRQLDKRLAHAALYLASALRKQFIESSPKAPDSRIEDSVTQTKPLPRNESEDETCQTSNFTLASGQPQSVRRCANLYRTVATKSDEAKLTMYLCESVVFVGQDRQYD